MDNSDADYGNLGLTGTHRRWPPVALGLAVVVVVAGIAIWLSGLGGDDGENQVSEPADRSASSGLPATTADSADPASSVSGSPAWTVAEDDLPAYISDPVFAAPDSPEAGVEVAFVNSEIATIRALAQPTVVEPELELWQTGFALRATNDTRQILVEDGQVIRPGSLTRIEIENVTLLSDSEADVEACYLSHGISIVVEDTTDRVETIGTLHGVFRLVRSLGGGWQLSELLTVIQDVEGFGACLDVTLTPVEPSDSSTIDPAEPEESSS